MGVGSDIAIMACAHRPCNMKHSFAWGATALRALRSNASQWYERHQKQLKQRWLGKILVVQRC
ncbi:hypothetical protein [Ktedonospora formicarum]|uniref:Uncharacterized protein n=1 Tax=Ktedonospora formicarum TaxID=2778364 RepID=A0A8J3MUS8_9CHLR|nr:hypothetical protein [Ktedonospora formicarum]GHO45725.1 hypothetical protein KSX_38880 [Ktedonospora formicarum]